MAKKMPKSLISWLMPKLRRSSIYWPGKSIARDMAKVQVQEGFYQNGKPKFITYWICAECERQGVKAYWKQDETAMDHIVPVVDIKGFNGDWNTVILTLFCQPTGYQCLCHNHHQNKTNDENVNRRIHKAAKKVIKTHKTTLKKLSKLSKLAKIKANKKKHLTKAKK